MVRFACLIFLIAAAGCSPKLATEKSFTLPAEGGDRGVLFNLPTHSGDQTVKAEVTSDAPVDVYVYAAKVVAEPRDLSPEDRAVKAILSKTGVTGETISVTVPGKEEYRVLVTLPRNAMRASGKVKFTN